MAGGLPDPAGCGHCGQRPLHPRADQEEAEEDHHHVLPGCVGFGRPGCALHR